MDIKIENKVQGREDKKERKHQDIYVLMSGAIFLIAIFSIFIHIYFLTLFCVSIIINEMFGFSFYNKYVKEYLYTGYTCLVIREVTTNLKNKKYAVYEEECEGKFTDKCKLKEKKIQGFNISLFDSAEEANNFRIEILKEEDITKEFITKIHP